MTSFLYNIPLIESFLKIVRACLKNVNMTSLATFSLQEGRAKKKLSKRNADKGEFRPLRRAIQGSALKIRKPLKRLDLNLPNEFVRIFQQALIFKQALRNFFSKKFLNRSLRRSLKIFPDSVELTLCYLTTVILCFARPLDSQTAQREVLSHVFPQEE